MRPTTHKKVRFLHSASVRLLKHDTFCIYCSKDLALAVPSALSALPHVFTKLFFTALGSFLKCHLLYLEAYSLPRALLIPFPALFFWFTLCSQCIRYFASLSGQSSPLACTSVRSLENRAVWPDWFSAMHLRWCLAPMRSSVVSAQSTASSPFRSSLFMGSSPLQGALRGHTTDTYPQVQ